MAHGTLSVPGVAEPGHAHARWPASVPTPQFIPKNVALWHAMVVLQT